MAEGIRNIDLTPIQREIMVIVQQWVKANKVPVPYKEIKKGMDKLGRNPITVQFAVRFLVRYGFITKTVRSTSRNLRYIQLRTVKTE